MDERGDKPRKVVRIIAWGEDENARRGRGIAAALALGCLAGILLASFVPFHLIHNPGLIAAHKRSFLHSYDLLHHHGFSLSFIFCHMGLNFLFYLPLGVLVALALDHEAKRRRFRPLSYLVPLLGFLISLPIEVTQIYFEDRDPDLGDTLMNTLGYLAGYGFVVWLVRHRGTDLARWAGTWMPAGRRGIVRFLLLVYTLTLLMLALLRLTQFSEASMILLQTGRQPLELLRGMLHQLLPWAPRHLFGTSLLAAALAVFGFLFRLAHEYWDARRLHGVVLLGGIVVVGMEISRVDFPVHDWNLMRMIVAIGGLLAGVWLAGRLEGRS